MKANFFLFIFFCSSVNIFSQGSWTQKANFSGVGRKDAVGFSIGSKGYIGTGWDNVPSNEFWEWDQATNAWTQKANFAGTARWGAVGFSIGTKGYIGTGTDAGNTFYKDLWEWDQTNNTWIQKSDFNGTAINYAVGFSIGSKGYIGTGWDVTNNPVQAFWEWDQASNTWTQKSNFTGASRHSSVGFSIGSKGYIGTGTNAGIYFKDFWEWNQITNTWIQKADFGGGERGLASGFSIGTKGYIAGGQDSISGKAKDFWEWNQSTNVWTQKTYFGGGKRTGRPVAFSIGIKGYIGIGFDSTFSSTKSFWEWYTLTDSAVAGNLICSTQCNGTASANASGGTPPYSYSWSTIPAQTSPTATGLCAGMYTITVSDSLGSAINTVTVTNLPPPAAPSICMVTVDSLSQNNIIIWDKTSFASADSFIIYREISTNNYQPLGAVPYNSLSLFVDTVRTKYFPNSGDPNAGTYRYKLAVRDSCGTLSLHSPYHNTIYMLNNSGAFSWLQLYTIEGSSNPVISYILMRDDNSTGAWQAINSVSGTQQTVIDPSYLTFQNTGSWRVETLWSINCTPTIKNPLAEAFIASRSNVYKVTGAGLNSLVTDLQISVFPNPTLNKIYVERIINNCEEIEIKVFDIVGMQINETIKSKTSKTEINASDLSKGIYFLHIKTDDGIAVKKIIKQ